MGFIAPSRVRIPPCPCHTPSAAGVSMPNPSRRKEDDMATRIPAAEITGISGAIVKRFCQKKIGQVPDSLGGMWHNQRVLKTLLGISRKTDKWDACDEQLKSFAHMAAVSMVGCSFCLDYGYFEARNRNLDVEKAREVPRWRESTVFTPLERDVLEYRRGDDGLPARGDRRAVLAAAGDPRGARDA